MSELEAGFAKLQGEDFEYYMQTYSIVLGRNSKKSLVDVDLASLGGGMNISRQHARIYYDFDRKRFALEVLGKNGCYVEGVLYLRGTAPVKLDTQDLLQIGDTKFYFLLPTKKICKSAALAAAAAAAAPQPPPPLPAAPASKKRGSKDGGESSRKRRKSSGVEAPVVATPVPLPPPPPPPAPSSASADEREVVAAIGSVLSDLCGPGEWMPISQLYSELQAPEQYSAISSRAKVWRVLESADTSDDPGAKPWAGLLALLRKYHEHFIINIKTKGRVTAEYVSLVSLVS